MVVTKKKAKILMLVGWTVLSAAFFAGLKFLPAWPDDGLKKAFMLLFGYMALMFGMTWKLI